MEAEAIRPVGTESEMTDAQDLNELRLHYAKWAASGRQRGYYTLSGKAVDALPYLLSIADRVQDLEASLRAIREPTPEMVEAMVSDTPSNISKALMRGTMKAAFIRAIDAARALSATEGKESSNV